MRRLFDLRYVFWFVLIFLIAGFSSGQITNQENSFEDLNNQENKAQELAGQWNAESIRRSIDLYLVLADQTINSGNKSKASFYFREAASASVLINKKNEALEYLHKALKSDNETNSLPDKIKTLSNISSVLLRLGKITESENQIAAAQKLVSSTNDDAAQASVYFSLGQIAYEKNNIDEAVKNFEQSLNLWQKSGDIKGEAQTLYLLSFAYLAKSEYLKGLEKSEESLKKWESINNKRGQALAQAAIGQMKFRMDENREALNYFQKAEELFPEDVDYLEKAILYNGMAGLYETYGAWQLSYLYRQRAYNLFQKENNLFAQLATLPSLGKASYKLNEEESAKQYFNEGLKLAEKINDKLFPAVIFEEIGNMYFEKNDYEQAEKYYKKAEAGLAKFNLKRSVAFIQSNLGKISANQNDFNTARRYYNTSLKTAQEINLKFIEANVLFYLAKLDVSEGNQPQALEIIEKSLKITEFLYDDVVNKNLRINYLSNVFDRYELYGNLLMKKHMQSRSEKYDVQALQTVEKSKARSMLENLSLSEADFMKDADPETVKREKEIRNLLNLKADKLTDLLSQNENQAEKDKVSSEIKELENQLEEIKANLKQNSPAYYAVKNPAPFDVSEFQQNVLDENSLLLEFSFGKTESYLWLIGKDEFTSYVLPPRDQIEDKIEKLRELLASREMLKDETAESFQTRIAQAEKEYSSLASKLSRDLFGQVADKFGDKKLIIVPDGKLGVFPVAALPLPNSEKTEPILLSNEVVYEPSASTLSLIAKFGNQAKSPTKSLLIFSDPVFSTDDNRLSGKVRDDDTAQNERAENFRFVESLNSLERLKSSKTEADSIINILGKSNVESFSGFAANRERLINANVSDYKILHFATHGIIDENRPELSGIVLSRFDENGRKQDEFFRLHDIYGMNLNSDLVVLSACYTGIGKEVKGEGLMSLNNAFLSVGAKTVLSSLWKVEDGATLELMKNFYEAMANEHFTPSKALQQAQIKMLKGDRYKSPFYWAAFTVQGDFKNVPQISDNAGVWKYFLPMPVILFFGAFWGLRIIRRRNRR